MTEAKKPHITTRQYLQMAANAARRHPFYTHGSQASYLYDTKHSKAWSDYGYPSWLSFAMYHDMYKRSGLARRGVDLPVDLCWMRAPAMSIGEEDHEESTLEKEARLLFKRLRLWQWMKTADAMQRVGRYSGIIWEVADNKTPDTELGKIRPEQIRNVIPAWEGQLIPADIDTNRGSARYGLPITYTYMESGPGRNGDHDIQSFTVHYSRVTILAEGRNSPKTIYGTSCLEPAFNALIDWEKIRGAGGEGFWRQAALRHMLKGESNQMPDQDLIDQISETYQDMLAGLDEMPYIGGMDMTPLGGQLSSPEHFKNTALEDIAAAFGYPAKSLVGTQTGVLAGNEDGDQMRQIAQSRCEGVLTYFVEDVIQWMVNHGALAAEDWQVNWEDLTAPTRKQQLENAKTMSEMNANPMTGEAWTREEIRLEGGAEATNDDLDGPLFDDEPQERDGPAYEGERSVDRDRDVSHEALNGAQWAQLSATAKEVSQGLLAPDSAISILRLAMPSADQSIIEQIIRDAAQFKPTIVEPEPRGRR